VRSAWNDTGGITFGLLLLEFADQQFELLDVAVKLLRRPAEPRATQHGELHLQLLDVQRLGIDLGRIGRDLDVLARQLRLQVGGEHPQRVRVGRERSARQGHGRIVPRSATQVQRLLMQSTSD